MKRTVPRILLATATAALVALAACSGPTGPLPATPAATPIAADAPASAVLVAAGATDLPMDSIRTLDTRDDPAELAARLRDAQLPDATTPVQVARSR